MSDESRKLIMRAAGKLRTVVAGLPVRHQCDWEADGAEIYAQRPDDFRNWVGETLSDAPGDEKGETTSAYIVAMQPRVALALAVWLENEAAIGRLGYPPNANAINVAVAVLGRPS